LHLLDDGVQLAEPGVPQPLVFLDPHRRVVETTRAQPAVPHAAHLLGRDEAGALEDAYVLTHARERHLEAGSEVGDGCIGVPELLYAASQIWSESFNVREMMNVLLVTYVLLVAILVFVMGRWERAMRIPGYST